MPNFANVPNKPFVSIAVADLMPDDPEVTERTQTTRSIGAAHMLLHLVEGDWRKPESSHVSAAELISRIVANARRQGVDVPTPTTEVD